ncbi:MAG: hypothetical protein AB1806_08705 [Acidobacteriota bacterium]
MRSLTRAGAAVWLAVVLHLYGVRPASAQGRPASPFSVAGGRVLFAGDLSITVGAPDPGWFTYTDYETSSLRRVRAGLAVEARITSDLSALFEARGETGRGVEPYAWYLRYRPWKGLVNLQAGRIPPVFGAYARRSYPQNNPLIGDPLLYQYLTALRPDAVPATVDDLLAMRARGWLVRYPVGDAEWRNGVPPIAASRWGTGVQALVAGQRLEGAVSVTLGSLSRPLARGPIRAPQVAGRVSWKPVVGLVVGISGSRSEFLDRDLIEILPALVRDHPYRQRAVGFDGECSWGYWLVRGEFVASGWSVPDLEAPPIRGPLRARGGYIEARRRVGPRLYVAARADRLAFSTVEGSRGSRTWDADVSRLELGAGTTLRRGLLLKGSYLYHQRGGGRVREDHLWAAQLLWWF